MEQNFDFWRFKFRPFDWDDLYGVQALINVIAQDEDTPYHYSLEWLYFVLNQDGVNATETCFVATLESDRLVGYSRYDVSDDPCRWIVQAGVHPDFTGIGIGRGLIAVNDFNALLHHPTHTPLIIDRQSSPNHQAAQSLLQHTGYHPVASDDDTVLCWEKALR